MSSRLRLVPRVSASVALMLLGLSTGCGRQQATAAVTATWTLVAATEPDPATAKPRPCGDFGATTVRFQVTPGGEYDFACTDYRGQSASFPAGYYNIQIIAFGSFGKVLDTIEFQESYAYGPTNLGDLRFKVR